MAGRITHKKLRELADKLSARKVELSVLPEAEAYVRKAGITQEYGAREIDRVIAGESGAAAFGCVSEILRNPQYQDIKEKLGLNETSRVLFFNTEGDTDKENYRSIVWDGAYIRD